MTQFRQCEDVRYVGEWKIQYLVKVLLGSIIVPSVVLVPVTSWYSVSNFFKITLSLKYCHSYIGFFWNCHRISMLMRFQFRHCINLKRCWELGRFYGYFSNNKFDFKFTIVAIHDLLKIPGLFKFQNYVDLPWILPFIILFGSQVCHWTHHQNIIKFRQFCTTLNLFRAQILRPLSNPGGTLLRNMVITLY